MMSSRGMGAVNPKKITKKDGSEPVKVFKEGGKTPAWTRKEGKTNKRRMR